MKRSAGKHIGSIVLGGFTAAGLLYANSVQSSKDQAIVQAVLLIFIPVAVFLNELAVTLKRKRLAAIAVVLLVAHGLFLRWLWPRLPMSSSMSILIVVYVEGIVLAILYARIGQSFDPDGPFGFSATEKAERAQLQKLKIPWDL